MTHSNPSRYGLFGLRVSLFLFMIAWALLKITTPAAYGASDAGGGIFGSFYGVSLGQTLVTAVGLVQILF